MDTRVPFKGIGHRDVRKSLVFVGGIALKAHVRKAVTDVEGNNITVGCCDGLSTSGTDRTVIHSILEVFELDTRMNGGVRVEDSILMEDTNDRTVLGIEKATDGTDAKIGKLVGINTGDVNTTIMIHADDVNIGAGKTTIGTAVDERKVLPRVT